MAITGAQVLLYTPQAEELRAALKDVLATRHVDAGDGWLIFALPPAEVGVHPAGEDDTHHELALLCDDVTATKAELEAKEVWFRGEPEDMGFGVGVTMILAGGVEVLLYEPRHETAIDV